MTKKEAISIITKCASLYASNLCDRQLAFVYRNLDNKPAFIEATFRANNFLHFTCVETASGIKANAFYRNAIDRRLKESDIIFKQNHTTELKLQVLHSIMLIAYSARMIGDYVGTHVDLYTEKVTGTTTACLGLIKAGQGYIPNTVLKEDIRNLIPSPPGKIFAILRKPVGQVQYAELTYQSPKCRVTVKALPPKLLSKIDNHLLSQLSAAAPDYP